MFELKQLSHDAVPAALEKANRYRLLNEPGAAESIYLDILAIDPDNQEALVNIVLAMSDRFSKDYAVGEGRIQDFLSKIDGRLKRHCVVAWRKEKEIGVRFVAADSTAAPAAMTA